MHNNDSSRETKIMEVYSVSSKKPRFKIKGSPNDEQAVRKELSKQFDHEFANEPLSEAEKLNNKKTKKRQ